MELQREFTRVNNCFKQLKKPNLKYAEKYKRNLQKLNQKLHDYWIYSNLEHVDLIYRDLDIELDGEKWIPVISNQLSKLLGIKIKKWRKMRPYETDVYETLIFIGYEYDVRLGLRIMGYILMTIYTLQREARFDHNRKTRKNRRLTREGSTTIKLEHSKTIASQFKNTMIRDTKAILNDLLADRKNHPYWRSNLRLLKDKEISQYIKENKL